MTIPFPLRRELLATLAACSLAATAATQAPAVQKNQLDPESGEITNRELLDSVSAADVLPSWRPRLAVQDDDYSVTGLFSERHGEFLKNGFSFRPNVRLGYRGQGTTEISDEVGKFSWQGGSLDAFVPMAVDPDMVLIVGATGRIRAYDFSVDSGLEDDKVHETSLNLGLGRFLTDDGSFYVEAMFRPGLYTDFGGTLTREDWKFYGDLIATYRFDTGFYGKVGAVYDGTFEEAPVYPVVGFSLMMADTFRVDMLLPKSLELAWLPDPAWIVKFGIAVDGDIYRVRTRVPTNNGSDVVAFDARTQEVDIYGDLTWRTSDSLSFFGRAGLDLLGNYDWEYPGARYDGSTDPVFFFEAGIGLSF